MELATDLLEAAGYVVAQAADAETGIEMARTVHPALVLLDISLPAMDGLTAARLLRDDAATAGVPVVILTAHAMKEDEEQARATGCAGFITKPIDTRSFSRSVELLLKRSAHDGIK